MTARIGEGGMPYVSVIIPIYNIEGYIAQAIDSVIQQSISLNNIEIILVDDGSNDGSGDIAKGYADQFPRNIQYKKVKNGGVSRARNIGLTMAHGEYIHFFDGDDVLSKNFYKESIGFLEDNKEVDFVASKLMFFDGLIDSHPLNYKFKETEVIDLEVKPDNPILHVISCVFRRESLEGCRFDERLSVSEDMKFLGDLLLRNKKYGVVATSTYYYRKRSNGLSAIGGKENNKSYYLETPKFAYEHLLKTWKASESRAIEYAILYDISYRLDQKTESVLEANERLLYINTIKSILRNMSDDVITRHQFLSVEKKVYIFKLKYGEGYISRISEKDNIVYFDDYRLYDNKSTYVHIDFLDKKADCYKIEGYIDGYLAKNKEFTVNVGGVSYKPRFVSRAQRELSFLDEVYWEGNAFEVVVDAKPGDVITFERADCKYKIATGKFTRIATYSYGYRHNDYHLISKSRHRIKIHNYSIIKHVLLELRLVLFIMTDWKLDVFIDRFRKMRTRNFKQLPWKNRIVEVVKPSLFVAEAICMIPRALILRSLHYIALLIKSRPIWIISDRGMAAGDNGEALFRYIMQRQDCPADVYFAVSRKSDDYGRIRNIGPVLNYGGLSYKLKFLLADKIISSHADVEVTNPFLRQINHFVDLYNFDFVFLQHGIIRYDLSGWLNRFEKNISLFITSSQKEYESIFNLPYYYPKENILLSGMPRYDFLENNPSNKIIIAPTYRNGLLRLKTNRYGERPYDKDFKNSDYCLFYNRLINSPSLIEAMKKAGLVGEFYIHPNFASQIRDFKGNDVFEVKSYPYDYNKAISEGLLMVSDYSSVTCDFAYMGKPIIYFQFDEDDFFASQPYDRGDFYNDKTDGFGPVTNDLNQVVHHMIDQINQKFKMQEPYRSRAKKFFAYHDKNSCNRIYAKLQDLSH